ncbi:MAG: lysophospholipid acyltransferase family protein [Thermodesulfobacteriota bacterium]
MIFTLVKGLIFILGHLPLGLARGVGKVLGRLFYVLDKRHRETVFNNLELAGYPEANREAIAREVFTHMGVTLLEVMSTPWLKKRDLTGYVEAEGLPVLEKALKRGKGVILFTAHLGNWELQAAWYAIMGYRGDVVVRDMDSPLAARLMEWMRTRHGQTMVLKKRSMRRLLKTLSRGGMVGILLDQNVARVEGVFVDFFGVPACTNKGPAMLAAVSGAAVIPTFITRRQGGHRVTIGPEIELLRSGDKDRDALENTARMTAVIEQAIRRNPGQWFWVHRRWKTRPE